jgi:hypothetical protein
MRKLLRLGMILGLVGGVMSMLKKRGGGDKVETEAGTHGDPSGVPPGSPEGHASTSGSSDPPPSD